ncbi:hypothetical protein MZD04_gp371 [Pseudomonas phage Psa21]|uniref:Uncharacterized protein n=1 Tax=Pseudomonas phage Psa21 TaxID=2530023 RepID=A0A481W6Q2_9CAUD|nr:hypothetical protein MZD04_gp371 [Pseudomonas phage Psa21]QBJ02897.1 hypothetical protein PSA21_371 [Pseudomonas phage Psa21]
MSDREFEVREFVRLNVDVMINKPGAGQVLYAPAGTIVQVMSYDPSLDAKYGVRAPREPYRNAPVTEAMMAKLPEGYVYAEPVGL